MKDDETEELLAGRHTRPLTLLYERWPDVVDWRAIRLTGLAVLPTVASYSQISYTG